MNMPFKLRSLLLFTFLASALAGHCTYLTLEGTVGWRTSGDYITITADQVVNNESGGASGSLRLRVWATTTPYGGGYISGYVMGTRSFRSVLEGGYYFYDISGTVAYHRPPAGQYYTTMTLEEYDGGTWWIVDYRTFDGLTSFGGAGGSGGTGGGYNGDLNLEGTVSWSSRGSLVTLRAGEISNDRVSGRSGSLRLRLWATSTPYEGGTIRGYIMGTKSFRALDAGYYYYDIAKTVTFTRPPRGYYYTTMTLQEYSGGRWYIVDYVTFSGRTRFN